MEQGVSDVTLGLFSSKNQANAVPGAFPNRIECPQMRSAVIVFLLAACCAVQAETIVLKNGRKILADSVREEQGKLYYEIGDDSYAIPKASVDHIDSYGSAARPSAHSPIPDVLPDMTSSSTIEHTAASVIKNDRVDDAAIAAAEKGGDNAIAAAANYQAGRFSLEHGDRDAASRYFDRALRFRPDDPVVLTNYAALLIRIGRPEEAVPLAEHATSAASDSPDAWAVLGYACEQTDRAKDAVSAFEKSLKLRPDATVQEFLARAKREASAEADYRSAESSHFSLKFEGHALQNNLPRIILGELDADYDTLVAQLGRAPHGSIPVILYTDEAFFDITRAPAWSTALNDGKLRIPVSGVSGMTDHLARVLRHELTHSFVTEISRGRCPLWLNEGVAQLMEPQTSAGPGSLLARLFTAHNEVPLNLLESSFTDLDANGAAIAYAESLAAVEYINETYGMSDIRRLLERIGEGASSESALRSTFNVGYGQFEEDIGTYLRHKYGS
jgi:tetratricopeptide (TPR) repeat protein